MSGLQLCPKCKKGHLYPVVTASASAEPSQYRETGSIRDYECAICGYKQKGKQMQNLDEKDKVSASVKKTRVTKPKPKPKPKPKQNQKQKQKQKQKKQNGNEGFWNVLELILFTVGVLC